MGQYYHACIIDYDSNGKAFVVAWKCTFDFGFGAGGLKLMEHCYIENPLMKCIGYLISPKGKYHGYRIVWAGDYADKEEHTGQNLYGMCSQETHVGNHHEGVSDHHFLVNQSRKIYVDLRHWLYGKELEKMDSFHPLSLLTCEGNGRGGGDLYNAPDWVGSWARDIITLEKAHPEDDYEEMVVVSRVEETKSWSDLEMVPIKAARK